MIFKSKNHAWILTPLSNWCILFMHIKFNTMKKINILLLLMAIIMLAGCGAKKPAGNTVNSAPANTDTIAQAPIVVDGCGEDKTCASQLLTECTIGKFSYNGFNFEIINKITAGCVSTVIHAQTGGQSRCLLPLGLSNVDQLGDLIGGDQIQLSDRLVTGICSPQLSTI